MRTHESMIDRAPLTTATELTTVGRWSGVQGVEDYKTMDSREDGGQQSIKW